MDTPDILIHVHPQLSAEGRARVEREVLACKGVVAASFDHHQHPHALMVVYDLGAIKGESILAAVRKHDPEATMVGL